MANETAPLDPVGSVRAMHEALGSLDRPGRVLSDVERVDLLRVLEELKAAAAAAQARVTAAFAASQVAEQAAAGVRASLRGRGVGAQVGLARRESPHRGQRHLALASVLVREMPCTLAAMQRGQLSEWQATLLARETAILTVQQRAEVDESLCGTEAGLERMLRARGDQGVVDAARRMAQRLDPASAVKRAARAAADRRVTMRALPDTMAGIHALLPVPQGVAVWAALSARADSLRAGGDPRGRGQIMADTLVERVTGQAVADQVPVALSLVAAAGTMLPTPGDTRDLQEPAYLHGYGSVPGAWARDVVRHAIETLGAKAAGSIRRLLTDPRTGAVVAMDARSRCFPEGLGELIATRDAGICRTPWCSAPIRHLDHVVGAADGGATSEVNGQGLCEACNYTKQAPGWQARPRPGPTHTTHTVETTTPTGHVEESTAPPLPNARAGIVIQVDWVSVA